MTVTTKSLLYRILYDALIEIRAEGHDSRNKTVFLLADLLHNVPLQLNKVDRGETTPEDIMQWLQMRARQTGTEGWLEHRIKEESRHGTEETPPSDASS